MAANSKGFRFFLAVLAAFTITMSAMTITVALIAHDLNLPNATSARLWMYVVFAAAFWLIGVNALYVLSSVTTSDQRN